MSEIEQIKKPVNGVVDSIAVFAERVEQEKQRLATLERQYIEQKENVTNLTKRLREICTHDMWTIDERTGYKTCAICHITEACWEF